MRKAERPRPPQAPIATQCLATVAGEGGRVPGQRNIGNIAAQRRDPASGRDLLERELVAVVVPQHVVGGERRLANSPRLREPIRSKIGLLHGADEPAAQASVWQRRIDQQEEPSGARAEWPDRELASYRRADGLDQAGLKDRLS
jgi:hypothetical protein